MDTRGPGSVISDSLNRISEIWDTEVEFRGEGDAAWSWVKSSDHWQIIKTAEAELDRIGKHGDPAELNAACSHWIIAWVKAIRGFSESRDGTNSKSKSQMSFGF
jgi:hypothetical protein